MPGSRTGLEGIDNSSEIRQLFESDQEDRLSFSNDPTKGIKIHLRDKERLLRAKEIVAGGGISDPNDLNILALIFLHGETVEDYKQALDLTTRAVEAGLPPQQSLIPQSTDRLLIQEQLDKGVPPNELKQKYGTQVRFDESGKKFKPSLDGTATKEEFERFGIES